MIFAVSKNERPKNGLLLLIALASSALFVQIFAAGAHAETIVERSFDYHPRCLSAYNKLPIDFRTGESLEENSGRRIGNEPLELTQHFVSHANSYLDYDDACFFKWACEGRQYQSGMCLKKRTVNFISRVGGVLFSEVALNRFEPYCSAFRVSKTKILTAAHCVRFLMSFRLFGYPEKSFKVFQPKRNEVGIPGSDLHDYALLNIEDNDISFPLTKKDFTRNTLPNHAINIISFSMPVYSVEKLSPENWLASVRFTRLGAARLWSFAEIGTVPSQPDIAQECLIHGGPTFAGMSGAPILAIWRPKQGSEEPTIRVIGVHLRNGVPPSLCGDLPAFNVGIRIPQWVIDLIED